jgi:hypothetical protein
MASIVSERIDEVMAWIRQGKSFRQVATVLDVDEATVRKFFKRNPDLADEVRAIRGEAPSLSTSAPVEGSRVNENDFTVSYQVSGSPTGAQSPEDVLRRIGLDPSEWHYTVDTRCWDSPVGGGVVTTLYYIAIKGVRKPESQYAFEAPAGWTPPKARQPKPSRDTPVLIPIFADPHAPLYEVPLIEASVAWLEQFGDRVSELVCLGDAADNSPFKRHKSNPRIDCTPNEAIWSTYELLARWANAAPGAKRRALFGNHDFWIADRILEANPGVMDIILPGEDEPHMSIATILKLKELGYEYEWTGGEYHDVTYTISDDLVLMHGTKTGKYGGATKEQEGWEGASIIQGHDHKLTLTAITRRLPMGRGETQRYALSAGTMARRDLGYDPKRNCNQGWPVVSLWGDGRWHVDFALYDPQTQETTWRDWRWTP